MPMDSPVAVKEAVLPFKRFRTQEGHVVDSVLGPEMRSTGEVMGIDSNFPRAFAKSQVAAYGGIPLTGAVFVSVADRDKRAIILPDAAAAAARLRDPRDGGHRRGAPAQRHRGPRGARSFSGQTGRTTTSRSSS